MAAPYNTFMLRDTWHRAIASLVAVTPFGLYAVRLPALPKVDTAKSLATIRRQSDRALAEAKAHPRDTNTIGALAMTRRLGRSADAKEHLANYSQIPLRAFMP